LVWPKDIAALSSCSNPCRIQLAGHAHRKRSDLASSAAEKLAVLGYIGDRGQVVDVAPFVSRPAREQIHWNPDTARWMTDTQNQLKKAPRANTWAALLTAASVLLLLGSTLVNQYGSLGLILAAAPHGSKGGA
jgi:hypothetical protein